MDKAMYHLIWIEVGLTRKRHSKVELWMTKMEQLEQ